MALTVKQILRSAGYPEQVLILDFETFFSKEYKMGNAVSVFEYVADPRFAIVGAAFKREEMPAFFVWGAEEVAARLRGISWNKLTVVGHNLSFDCWILAKKFGIYPKFTVDTVDLARAWDASAYENNLDILATRFNLGRKGRTMDFEGVTEANATPGQWEAMSSYATNDAELTSGLLTTLLPKLTNPKIEIPLAHATLELRTKPELTCDMQLGKILVEQMQREQSASIERLGLTVKDISSEKTFHWHLEQALIEAGDLLQRYMKVTARGYAAALAKDDDMRDVLLNHPSPRVRDLCEAKVGRRSWPLHIKRVQRIMRINAACEGLLPVPLNYHAAHTGRDGGAEKINLQNLPKHGIELLKSMRGLLRAGSGKRLVRKDLSAIEARVLAWLANDKDMMANFAAYDQGRDKFDIYQKFAAECLNKSLSDITDEDRGKIGKIGILGCGFGMGPYLPGSNKTLPNVMFLASNIPLEMAERVVGIYREHYSPVCMFWNNLERAFKFVLAKGIGATVGHLKLFTLPDCPVVIQLPSTRCLHYHNARLRDGQIRLGNVPTWGGALTENVVQATARDILLEAFLRLVNQGVRVVHRVHDELIASAALSETESVKEKMKTEMTRIPIWGKGLPLAGKVRIAVRYDAK
jgi:DNA polymerase